MSWGFKVEAKDETFEHAVRTAFERERAGAHHNPAARRALQAVEEFVLGAIKSAPKGTSFRVETHGHMQGDHSCGQASVTVGMFPTPPDA